MSKAIDGIKINYIAIKGSQ